MKTLQKWKTKYQKKKKKSSKIQVALKQKEGGADDEAGPLSFPSGFVPQLWWSPIASCWILKKKKGTRKQKSKEEVEQIKATERMRRMK